MAGLLLGLCFGITLKSTVLLISVLLSAVALFVISREKSNLPAIHLFRSGIVFLSATALVPAIIAIFFAAKGVGDAFWQCVIRYQFFGHLFQAKQWIFAALFVVALPLVIYLARRLFNSANDVEVGFRRAFIALVICFYFLALRTFWPLIARGDYLPFYPLLFIFVTAVLNLKPRGVGRFRRGVVSLPAIVAFGELVMLVVIQPLWKNDTADQTKLLRDVLILTTPDDYIFDSKGETVFRQRCFRPILEAITRKRIRRGLIPDDAPQRCIATRTCVAATGMKERFPPGPRDFLERNYLPVTDILRVVGIRLKKADQNTTRYDFDVVVPTDYEIIAPDGAVSGKLDGISYDGSRFLTPGRHTFESASIRSELILIWARAAERNFTPFPGGFASSR